MDRQKFLETLLILPVGVFLVRCSSSGTSYSGTGGTTGTAGSSGGTRPPAAAPTKSGTQTIYSSSNDQSHFHTFALDDGALTDPPSAGVSGETSLAQSHTHSVTISSDQLQQVGMGQSVIVITSSNSGHTHAFTFTKVG
jgi:hypothetical protein